MPSTKKSLRRRPSRTKKRLQSKRKPLLNTAFGTARCHPAVMKDGSPVKNCIPATVLEKLGAVSDTAALATATANKEELLQKYFRPAKPNSWDTDPDMWLDNTNIDAVLRQYQEAYPWFKFLGVFPIDFSVKDPYAAEKRCLAPVLCDLDLQAEMKTGTKAIGIIYNLDPHYKEGSHWVANFIDLRDMKPAIYYFDSYGEPAPNYIKLFMEELWRRAPMTAKPLLAYNARRFQYGDSECGMYSTYFIVAMLQGVGFRKFVRHPVPDREMIRLRNVFFFDSDGSGGGVQKHNIRTLLK